MKEIDVQQALGLIKNARVIMACTHVQPDGDAIGSLLAFGSLLERLGKQAVLLCQDLIPSNLRTLPGWDSIKTPEEAKDIPFDLCISIDASDFERIGTAGEVFRSGITTLVIDHHATNTRFGQYNYVDDNTAASGVLVYRFFQAAGVAVDAEAAYNLYAAISTDTGNFNFGQMNEEFFLQMANLMKAGLPIQQAARNLHLTKNPYYIKLLGRALNSLQFYCDGQLSGMHISLKDFQETGAAREFADGIVNYGLNIIGVKLCFMATEESDGVKFSLRALPPYDVAAIASEFGGGGHVLAAGCTLKLPLQEAILQMEQRMAKALQP